MAGAVVVLAGGAARRLGGVLKPAVLVGGRPLVGRVLDAATAWAPRIVVGPPALRELLPPDVTLTREVPPGGGPVAGLAAALDLVPPLVPELAVLSADLPFLTATVLTGLSTALAAGDAEVAVLHDDQARPQWLCAVWRRAVLTRQLAALGESAGARMRDLVAGVVLAEVALAVRPGHQIGPPPPWFDCDTEDDLRRARRWAQETQ